MGDEIDKPQQMQPGIEAACVVTVADLEKMRDALLDCAAYFQHRDEMNAFVHLAPVRLSPITVKVTLAEGRLASIIGTNIRVDVSR